MRLARVVGNLVSTIKEQTHYNYKLLIVEYLDGSGNPVEAQQIVFDGARITSYNVCYTKLLRSMNAAQDSCAALAAGEDSVLVLVPGFVPAPERAIAALTASYNFV